MITDKDINDIKEIVHSLVGQVSWEAKLGYGSFLTFNFGKLLPPDKRSLVIGEWHLWIRYCAWRIETDIEVIAGSEDEDDALLDKNVKRLQNVPIVKFDITKPALETTIHFSNALRLRLFPVYSTLESEADNWLLFTPDEKVLKVGPGANWSHQKSN